MKFTAFQIMVKKVLLFVVFILFAGIVFSQRVVSMAPAVTEIIFALGQGNRLVGVSKFCDYPAPARKIAKVGGFLDVNMEALLALTPEIVIAYPEQYSQVKFIESRALVLVVKHQRLTDLWDSIHAIGRALRTATKAGILVESIKKKLADVANRASQRKKASTLIIAGRNADELKNMYIIGNNDFLNDLLQIAGGVNAYEGTVNYPSISMETVILLNPDFIFEISAHYENIADEKVFKLWNPFKMLQAVQKKRIRIIKQSFWLRPGPRVGMIAEELAGFFSADNSSKTVNAN